MSPWRRPNGIEDPAYILGQIRSSLRWLIGATIVLYVVMLGIAFKVYTDSNRVHDSLCTLRGDLQTRVATTQKLLREHPEGFAGIPADVLRQSMEGQERTITALGNLNCPIDRP